jgi:hypothetical protein
MGASECGTADFFCNVRCSWEARWTKSTVDMTAMYRRKIDVDCWSTKKTEWEVAEFCHQIEQMVQDHPYDFVHPLGVLPQSRKTNLTALTRCTIFWTGFEEYLTIFDPFRPVSTTINFWPLSVFTILRTILKIFDLSTTFNRFPTTFNNIFIPSGPFLINFD